MKVLLATPELAPWSGATPLATAARGVTRELDASPDTEIAVALPASGALLQAHSGRLTDCGPLIPEPGTPASREPTRILQLDRGAGPEVFLLDVPSLREAFDPGRADGLLVEQAFHWASLVVALLARIEPAIHLVHGFGWESALIPILVNARRLPVATALSSPPARATGPTLRPAVDAASRWGLDAAFPAPPAPSLDEPLYPWAASRADGTDALPALGERVASPGDASASPPTADRKTILKALGLESEAATPLFYVPGSFPASLLPVLPRFFDTGARVVFGSRPRDSRNAATLIALAQDRPGHVAHAETAPEADLLTAADFVLLHPESDAEPEIPRRALALGCAPILSSRHPALADAAFRAPGDESPAIVFRDDSPEAIWAILKRAIALHADSSLWSEHLAGIGRAAEVRGGISPELAALYRRAVARKLVFD